MLTYVPSFLLGVMSSKNQGKVKRISPSILSLIQSLITMQFKGAEDEEILNVFLDRFLSISSTTLQQLRLDYYISIPNDSAITADLSPDESTNDKYRSIALYITQILLTRHKPDEYEVDETGSMKLNDNQGFVTVEELLNSSEVALTKWREYVNRNSQVRSNMDDRIIELEEKKKATEKLRAIEARPKRKSCVCIDR